MTALIILLMCTAHGDMMKVKSIEASEALMSQVDQNTYDTIMDRTPTCAQKIAQLTGPVLTKLVVDQVVEPLPIQCTPTSAVPFPIKDTLVTLSCHSTDQE